MKFSTIQLGNNKIEIFNSYLGKETIMLNNKVVSEKNSIRGAKHTFKMLENDRQVNCKLNLGYGANGVVMDLYVDDVAIIESPKSSVIITFIIIAFVIGGVAMQIAYQNY
ncbi:hypothetical protein SAMN05444372_10360 [Flavobacterium micromati]|jgi:hypothetical protein|uniref:Uncharacterized protein n=1 Tax=Flavobacterium micromati TaxID=229205 RepID=A0A1M5HPC5_9FLAO|nr:hypothetical protein [Flavobacterium micromati]SHG17748.1 hypothetical protein SAMN05444372_10360 [Flavobacterium micromati]